jgi:hypothetical protein
MMNKRILFTAVSAFVLVEMLVADCITLGWGLLLFKFFGVTFMTGIWLAVVKVAANKLKQSFFMPELQEISCKPGFLTEYVLYYVLILYAVAFVACSVFCVVQDGNFHETVVGVNMAGTWIEGLFVYACAKAIKRWKTTGNKHELLFPWPVK